MKKKLLLILSTTLLLVSSCSTPKNVAYLQDLENQNVIIPQSQADIKVKPEDKISIVVSSREPLLTEMFNLPVVSHRVGQNMKGSGLNNNSYVSYYTVNKNGYIDFPIIGEIHVEGMTRSQLAEYVKMQLVDQKLLKDPVVIVEFINTGITIAGEVNNPGRYEINRDRITLLEALGLAGDLTIQGQRENVLVVREVEGKPTAYRVDLTDASNLVASPVYYLQQNDYVYVEPNNMKKRSSTVNGNNVLSASFWVSVASLLTSVAVLIFK